MSDFTPAYPDIINLDSGKRVYYSHGLVLGVDEFVQEELYLLERQRVQNRGLHGYGTVCGLQIAPRTKDGQPELLVAPGVALDPQGREIRVTEGQCAKLNDWLLRHRDEVLALLGASPTFPANLALNLVLSYAECTTDQVPVPSGACQSLDRTMVPSRVADSFQLRLTTDLSVPAQVEEVGVRSLIETLAAVPTSDSGDMTEQLMGALVRGLAPGGTPVSPAAHGMRPDEAEALIRAAFRIWITEVRPKLLAAGGNCTEAAAEDEVLLGRIRFAIANTDAGLRVSGGVTIDEGDRPFLMHTRLMQEYLHTCCAGGVGGGGGDGGGADVMLLSKAQVVTGSKTFAGGVMLVGAGRVRRRIDLPAASATMTYADTTKLMTFRSVPVVRFSGSGGPGDYKGTVVYDLNLPDDMDPNEPMRVRLFWYFDVLPPKGGMAPASAFKYRWNVRNAFFAAGAALPQTLDAEKPVAFEGEVSVSDEFKLQQTDYQTLATTPGKKPVGGALHINVAVFDPPDARLYLVKAELDYVANRLGGTP